jgi:hypothetical protein
VRDDRALAFQDRDPDAVMPERKLARARQPEDAGADDDNVALPRGMAGVRHRAIVITIKNPMNGTCQCRRPTAPARHL